MGNKTRAAQPAHRASSPHEFEGVPLPNGKNAWPVHIEPIDAVTNALRAFLSGRRDTGIPVDHIHVTLNWLRRISDSPPGERTRCMSCAFEFAGFHDQIDSLSHLSFVEGRDGTVVLCLCATCGAGKSLEEVYSIVNGHIRIRNPGIEVHPLVVVGEAN